MINSIKSSREIEKKSSRMTSIENQTRMLATKPVTMLIIIFITMLVPMNTGNQTARTKK